MLNKLCERDGLQGVKTTNGNSSVNQKNKLMLQRILYSALFLVIALILYLNIRLYYQPQWSTTAPQINLSVEAQLNYLQKRMHAGAAVDMQKIYPEGYLFLNALYGLSWCNLLAKTP